MWNSIGYFSDNPKHILSATNSEEQKLQKNKVGRITFGPFTNEINSHGQIYKIFRLVKKGSTVVEVCRMNADELLSALFNRNPVANSCGNDHYENYGRYQLVLN